MVTSELLVSFLLTPLAQYSWVGLLPSAKLTFILSSVKFYHCVLHSCKAIMVCFGGCFYKISLKTTKPILFKNRKNTETYDKKPTHRQMYMKTIPARLCRFKILHLKFLMFFCVCLLIISPAVILSFLCFCFLVCFRFVFFLT